MCKDRRGAEISQRHIGSQRGSHIKQLPMCDQSAICSPVLIFSNAVISPATSPLRSTTPVYTDAEKSSILLCPSESCLTKYE